MLKLILGAFSSGLDIAKRLFSRDKATRRYVEHKKKVADVGLEHPDVLDERYGVRDSKKNRK